jgi:chromosome segregation ATPase
MTDNYEKEISKLKNENLTLTSELEKTNNNLKIQKNESELLENKLKNLQSNKEEEQSTIQNKDKLIQTQKEILELCKSSEKELSTKISTYELDLSRIKKSN